MKACRDVKIMRERPFGGEAWREFLRKQGIAGNSVSRDYLRNEFVKCIGTTEVVTYVECSMILVETNVG